jgi:flagella basal body P-ring formation protein FlgA
MMPWLPLLAALASPACIPVHSDRIHARDLASAQPAFAALPPDLELGFAPAPGATRIFPLAEIRRIAMANGLKALVTPGPVCFAWPLSIPPEQSLIDAMKQTLAGRNPDIEVIERSLMPAPPGTIVFPLAGLSAFSDSPAVWRGYIEYAPARRFPLWARVLVRVHETRVVAKEALHTGQRIRASQLVLEPYAGAPTRDEPVTAIGAAEGMLPRFEIAAGAMLSASLLERPKDVERGDTVAVVVSSGGARIEAAGIAEQSGPRGATILVRNPKSGKEFHALVAERDKVVVDPQMQVGLAGGDTKR